MKALYYFFSFLLIGLLIAIFFIIKDAKDVQSNDGVVEISSDYIINKLEDIVNNSWNAVLANKTVRSDKPITNELYINLDLQDVYDMSKKKYYKLEIDKNDQYSMFCIKQALENNNLKYFLISNKKESQIIVDVQEFSKLHKLVDDLENNKIKTNFIEIWL